MLVGDASSYGELLSYVQNEIEVGSNPEALIVPASEGGGKPALGIDRLPDSAVICSCHNVGQGGDLAGDPRAESDQAQRRQVLHQGGHRLRVLHDTGDRHPEGRAASARASRSTITSASTSRTRARSSTTWCASATSTASTELILRARPRRGLRDLQAGRRLDPGSTWNENILERRARGPAGHQRSLSGQHPARRHLLGGAAGGRRRDHARPVDRTRPGRQAVGLYTKITGGQRIDLFGARLEQLPDGLARAGRGRLRIRSRLRQGACAPSSGASAAPGVATASRIRSALAMRDRESLQGSAQPAQAEGRRLRLRARVRRGSGQGLRRDRHREGLQPLRLRQRRHEAAARAAAGCPTSTKTPSFVTSIAS